VEGGGHRFLDLSLNRIYTFDASGRLIRIGDRRGNALTITQGANGPERVEDGLGRSLSFTYAGGKLIRVEDQTARGIDFLHTGDNLTSVTDTQGAVHTYTYAAGPREGLMASATDPEGAIPFTQAFDATGRITQQTDGSGNATTLQYDLAPGGDGSSATDASNGVTGYVHDGPRNLASITDSEGKADTRTYDANRRLTSYTDPLGNRFSSCTINRPATAPA
jgi:YD repeat-containing protein